MQSIESKAHWNLLSDKSFQMVYLNKHLTIRKFNNGKASRNLIHKVKCRIMDLSTALFIGRMTRRIAIRLSLILSFKMN